MSNSPLKVGDRVRRNREPFMGPGTVVRLVETPLVRGGVSVEVKWDVKPFADGDEEVTGNASDTLEKVE